MESLITLVYLSTALQPFSENDLRALLQKSRENNSHQEVTGLLLYKNQHFMQALEGPHDVVHALTEKIRGDTRHFGMVTLIDQPLAERRFGEWSMGFKNLESPEIAQEPGFGEFMNTPLTLAEFKDNPTKVQKLLMSFKRRM